MNNPIQKSRAMLVLMIFLTISMSMSSIAGDVEKSTSLIFKKQIKQSGKILQFIENKGQFADQKGNELPDVKFIAKFGNRRIYVRESGISFVVFKKKEVNKDEQGFANGFNVSGFRQDMVFKNCNIDVEIRGIGKSNDYINYYLPHCPQGITDVYKYEKIIYDNIYDNIDLVLYSNDEGKFQYDFTVNPGGDPSEIALFMHDAEDVSIENNKLITGTPCGEIIQSPPFTYQMVDGKKVKINSSFSINKDKLISFKYSAYDRSKPLIIDPVTRLWGTFFGGEQMDILNCVDFDTGNNIIACGATDSETNIASPGAYQPNLNYYRDAVIVKLDIDGNRVWSTYYGGSESDYAGDLVTDKQDNIYVFGTSNSPDVLGEDGWQQQNNGEYDSFIAKFSPSGYRIWGTFYGGESVENPFNYENYVANGKITVDKWSNVFVTAKTLSDKLVGDKCMQCKRGGEEDAFIAKFDSSGNMIWDTYYGGEFYDRPGGMTTDEEGNLLICGWTMSEDVFASEDAMQKELKGDHDGFISKFDTDGNRIWSTYYGGIGWDGLMQIALDPAGNIYLSGATTSEEIGYGRWKDKLHGYHDALVAKFTGDGRKRIWSVYFGGSYNEWAYKLDYSNGALYITGSTYSEDLNVRGGYQKNLIGNRDAFFAKFDTSGKRLWGSYYGGSSDVTKAYGDNAYTIRVNNNNEIVICGNTDSKDGYGSSGGFQQDHGGGICDGWIALFKDYNVTTGVPAPREVCPGEIIEVPFIIEEPIDEEYVFEVLLSDSSGSYEEQRIIGSLESKTSGTIEARIPKDIPPGDNYRISVVGAPNEYKITIHPLPQPEITGRIHVCSEEPQIYEAAQQQGRSYKWSTKYGTVNGADDMPEVSLTWAHAGIDTLTLTETIDATGCTNSTEKEILIDKWNSEIIGRRLVCKENYEQVYVNKMQYMKKKWEAVGGEIIGADEGDEVKILWTKPPLGELSLILTSPTGSCSDTTTIEVTIDDSPLPAPVIAGPFAVCDNDIAKYSTPYNSENSFKWHVHGGRILGSDTANSITVEWGSEVAGKLIITETTPAGCLTTIEQRVYINAYGLEIDGETEICRGGTYSYKVDSIPRMELLWMATNGEILNDPTSDSIAVKWEESGIKILNLIVTTITDSGTCEKTFSRFIEDTEKKATLSVPEIEFDPKEQYNKTIAIPLVLEEPGCLLFEDQADSATVRIRLRKSMFLPVRTESLNYHDEGIWRTITLKTPVAYTKVGDTVLTITGYGLLGDTLETPVYIDSLFWSNLDLGNKYESGKLRLTNVPDIGGLRLLKTSDMEILAIYPIPAINEINILIESAEADNAQLGIYNCLGERVLSERLSLHAGKQECKFKLKNLSTGVYRVVVTNSKNYSTKNIIINKR